ALLIDPHVAPPSVHSFPTRRSSDLLGWHLHPGQHLTQEGLHSYVKSTTQRDTSALLSSRCLLEMERDSRHITFLGTPDRLWAMAHNRSLRPFPPLMCTTMRWLSMSVAFRWVNSAFLAPVA